MARRFSKKPVLIVTCGNPDAGDDGFGHAVAEGLRVDPLPGITVAELGTRPADLLDHLPGYAALIIVDAVCCPGEKPGGLIDVDWFDPARPVLKSEEALSTHARSLGLQIELGQSLGMLPSVVRLVGANIVQLEIGSPLTEAVGRCIPDAVKGSSDNTPSVQAQEQDKIRYRHRKMKMRQYHDGRIPNGLIPCKTRETNGERK